MSLSVVVNDAPAAKGYRSYVMPLIFTLAYAVLQHRLEGGINWLLLSLLVQVSVHFTDAWGKRLTASYMGAQLLTLVLAASVAIYGADGVILLLIMSWMLLKSQAENAGNTLLPLSFFDGFVFTTLGHWRHGLPRRSANSKIDPLYVIMSMVVVTVFFLLYTSASQGFGLLMEQLGEDLDAFVIITLAAGYFMGAGLLRWKFIKPFHWDEEVLSLSVPNKSNEASLINMVNLTLALLVFMALVAVVANALFIFSGAIDNYSDKVHETVISTIVAVGLAVLLILSVNYWIDIKNGANRLLVRLLYGFVVVNGLLVLNTLAANQYYVSNLGLTHKRFGVYVYLLVVLVGLVLTMIYLRREKNMGWLLNGNFWTVYAVIAIYTVLPVDLFIAQSQLATRGQNQDVVYLSQLDPYALPVLLDNSQLRRSALIKARYEILLDQHQNRPDFREWTLATRWAKTRLDAMGVKATDWPAQQQ